MLINKFGEVDLARMESVRALLLLLGTHQGAITIVDVAVDVEVKALFQCFSSSFIYSFKFKLERASVVPTVFHHIDKDEL